MDRKAIWKEFATPMALLIMFVVAIFGVLGLTKNLTKAPELSLTSGDNIVTDQAEVPITGVVKNTNKLSVNDKVVTMGQDGSFSVLVPVMLGDNVVSVEAGSGTKITRDVKITREEVAKAITAVSTATTTASLSPSGPVENVVGSTGLAAVLMSLAIYRKSIRRKPLQKAISLV
jgi:hypothetical protein